MREDKPIWAPWMDWMRKRLGWSEKTHDKELAQYWKYTNYHPNTVVGPKNAWCAMIGCAALEENGFKSNLTAGAAKMKGTGRKCELTPGCGVVIKHSTGPRKGGFHFTFCDHIDDNGITFGGLGGNQHDKIGVDTYPIADIVECFWPEIRKTEH